MGSPVRIPPRALCGLGFQSLPDRVGFPQNYSLGFSSKTVILFLVFSKGTPLEISQKTFVGYPGKKMPNKINQSINQPILPYSFKWNLLMEKWSRCRNLPSLDACHWRFSHQFPQDIQEEQPEDQQDSKVCLRKCFCHSLTPGKYSMLTDFSLTIFFFFLHFLIHIGKHYNQ